MRPSIGAVRSTLITERAFAILQLMVVLFIRIVVHLMATVLLVTGVIALFSASSYESGIISAEDQSHLRVFWAVPIIMSLIIHYSLYAVYISKDVQKRVTAIFFLKTIAIWMAIAAIVRIFSILVLNDPMPRLTPIFVEIILVPLLWFLSTRVDGRE